MPWGRIDDKFHRNAKQLALSDASFRLWVVSWSYCLDGQEVNGYLSEADVSSLLRVLRKNARSVRQLVELRCWDRVPGGYVVHDFDQYVAPTSTDRVRRFRERKGNADETLRNVSRNDPVPVPVPGPVPVPISTATQSHSASAELALTGELSEADPAAVVHRAWAQATGHTRTALTDARRAKVKARMKEGFSVDELVLVVSEGWRNDPWNERVLHTEFELLLRDAAHVEKFLKLAREGAPIVRPRKTSLELSVEQDEAMIRSLKEVGR